MSEKDKSQENMGIITFPMGKNGITPLDNLIELLNALCTDLYLITGNFGYDFYKNDQRVKVEGIMHKSSPNLIIKILKYFIVQLKISYYVIKNINVQQWVFFIGGEYLLLPVFLTFIMNKKIIFILAGNPSKSTQIEGNLIWITNLISRINFILSDKIIVYSNSIIEERELHRYISKVLVLHRHFIDFNKFKLYKKYNERKNIIGYVGTLAEIKGIMNFLHAIPLIERERNDLEFIIIGEGKLRKEIEEYKNEKKLTHLKIVGWVNHDDLPIYLNEMKLLILPSYTEGLPNIILEAMACGTPVLTTNVGSVPDLIQDSTTGFILKNNSVKSIKKGILYVLNYKNMDDIIENGLQFVKREFEFVEVLKNWEKFLKRK